MTTNQPENETSLYPFRLEEAKLNLGNVVTRDGRKVVYIGHSDDPKYPLGFRVSGCGNLSYTLGGSFAFEDKPNTQDLFMATPPPEKPGEGQAVDACPQCGGSGDEWLSAGISRSCIICGGAGVIKARNQNESLTREDRATKPALSWVPVSERMPTKADGQKQGNERVPRVRWLNDDPEWSRSWEGNWNDKNNATHWQSLPTLPPSTQTEEGAERKVFEAWASDKGMHLGRTQVGDDYSWSNTRDAWKGWQAALTPSPGAVERWQPIETAPEVRTVLTIHYADLYPVSAFRMGSDWLREIEGPEDVPDAAKHSVLRRAPTHWMEIPRHPVLPPAPSENGGGE